jgi:hypothetical protein
VTQHHNTFSIAGTPTVVTFDTAIPIGTNNVEVLYGTRSASSGSLDNIVEDTSPQLGGNLDLNSFAITGLVIGTDVQAELTNAVDDLTTGEVTQLANIGTSAISATEWGYVAGATAAFTSTLSGNITTNNAKVTNVSTDLTTTAAPATVTINSSDGTNAAIASADATNAGVMTTSMYDEHVVNNAKVSDVNHNVSTDLAATHNASTVVVTSSDGTDATINAATATTAGIMTEAIFDAHVLNTAKVSDVNHNVSTDLTTTAAPTTITINSSDGTNAAIAAADGTNAGVMTTAMFDEHVLNNAKVSDVNHNVTTDLSTTHNASTVVVASSDGTNATINAATATTAGIMTEAIYDAHVLNNAKATNVTTNLLPVLAPTTVTITSSDGSNAQVGAADGTNAGVMTTSMFDAHVLNNAKATNANHTGDVTGSGALTIAAGAVDLAHMSSESVDEDNLHISNSPTNGYMLTAQSGNAGGLTWAAASGGGGISNIVEDTTPQLGGDLSLNGNVITGLVLSTGTNTGDEVAASLTVSGTVEIATVAETNTGTDATRAVSPAGLTGWTGDTGIVTVGTVATGTWQGTAIAETYIADDSVTLAKMSGGVDGSIITFDAAGDPVAVGPGTDGQVLTSTGAGSPPAFETAAGGSGGAWTFLSLVTASSASTVDIETTFDNTYHAYVIVASDVYAQSASGNLECLFKLSTAVPVDGGTYRTAGYYGHRQLLRYDVSTYTGFGMSNASAIDIQDAPGSSAFASGWVMTMPLDPTLSSRKFVTWAGFAGNSYKQTSGAGKIDTNGVLTGIRYKMNSGTLSGNFRLYGIAKS